MCHCVSVHVLGTFWLERGRWLMDPPYLPLHLLTFFPSFYLLPHSLTHIIPTVWDLTEQRPPISQTSWCNMTQCVCFNGGVCAELNFPQTGCVFVSSTFPLYPCSYQGAEVRELEERLDCVCECRSDGEPVCEGEGQMEKGRKKRNQKYRKLCEMYVHVYVCTRH